MASISGKTVLVTGSTDGIGKHTARKLKQAGAHVLVHGRNAMRVADTAAERQHVSGGAVSAYTQDISTASGALALAKAVRKDWPALDVLVNNAGVFEEERSMTEDGYEKTWATNVLAPFILSRHLSDAVTQRIVTVSSISAARSFKTDDIHFEKKAYSAHGSYALSKAAAQVLTAELADRATRAGWQWDTLCLDPGTVNTKMLYAGWGPCGVKLEDANDLFWAITCDRDDIKSGAYYVSRRKRSPCKEAQDAKARARAWDILEAQAAVATPLGG